jgi:hypothetical protein
MKVGLKPRLILDENKVAPVKFVKKRIELIDGSVLR